MSITFNLFDHFTKITKHKNANLSQSIMSTPIYIDFETTEKSSGFKITIPTRANYFYRLSLKGQLIKGDKIFIYCESNLSQKRLIPRTYTFDRPNVEKEFLIYFRADYSLTDFGILSWTDQPSHLQIKECLITPVNFEDDPEQLTEESNKSEESDKSEESKSDKSKSDEQPKSDEQAKSEGSKSEEQAEESKESKSEESKSEKSNPVIELSPIQEFIEPLKELLPSQFILPSDLNEDDEFEDGDEFEDDEDQDNDEFEDDDDQDYHDDDQDYNDQDDDLDDDDQEIYQDVDNDRDEEDQTPLILNNELDENMLLMDLGLDNILSKI